MLASGKGAPSALRVALRRAAHQLFDSPLVLEDPVVLRLLGAELRGLVERTPRKQERVWSRGARAFAVGRSRMAEDAVAEGYARGVRQYCLLGAGLDTFAWRNPFAGLQVWEVDLPQMRSWKRELAGDAGLAADCSTEVRWDFEEAGLAEALLTAGMASEPTVFAFLGVAPYLGAAAFERVIDIVRNCGPGSALVMDYRQPKEVLGEEEQRQHHSLAARLEDSGEPFRQFWTPEEMRAELAGFTQVEDLGASELNERFFAKREDGLAVCGEAVRVVCTAL